MTPAESGHALHGPVIAGCWCLNCSAAKDSGDGEPFGGLAGDTGDEVEVLVEVEHGKSGEFRGCGDDEVRDRRGAVLAAVGEKVRTSTARSSMAGVRYSTGIAETGGWRSPVRRSARSGPNSRLPAG